jgi:hypothetical protein
MTWMYLNKKNISILCDVLFIKGPYLLVAFFLSSAERLLVTLLSTLSMRMRLACSPSCTPTFLKAKFLGIA